MLAGCDDRCVLWIVITWVVRGLLALVFVVAGVVHFVPAGARGMRAAIPPALRRPGLPSPATLVAFTGLCELAGGLALVAPGVLFAESAAAWLRPLAGVALAVFLLCVFPANAHMARYPEKFGPAAIPLVPRAIGQLVLIGLVLVAGFGPA